MARRHQEEEHENHERWLVSYADFITLLFAFFVVMYALSQINTDKYRILSDSLVSAFSKTSAGGQQPINAKPAPLIETPNIRPSVKPDEAKVKAKNKMRNMASELKEALGPLVQNGQVRVTEGALGITVEINASVLFSPGDARLAQEAVRALTAVARILAPTDFPIIVEGHTDNTPISTTQFPSNWELSGVRASSVVRLFVDNGVAANRLTATGYADQRPVVDNSTPEGRQRNRRVAITIESRTPDVQVELPVLTKNAAKSG